MIEKDILHLCRPPKPLASACLRAILHHLSDSY